MPGLKARTIAVLAAASVLAGGLLSPAQGSPPTPAPPAADAAVPELTVSSDEPPVASLPLSAPSAAADSTTSANITEPRPVVWPVAGSATVAVTDEVTQAAALPIFVGATSTGPPPTTVDVEVLGPQFARSVGGWGLTFTVSRSDGGSATAPVTVEAVYDGFRHAVGGNFASRLHLVRLPGCAVVRPQDPTCVAGEPVSMRNDLTAGRLVGEVVAGGDPDVASSPPVVAPVEAVYVLRTTANSQFGSYESTSLAPSGEWKTGLNTGEFSWSYALPMPPTPTGASPPALGYSSGSVDGRTSETNPQASWVGLGWELSAGFIERQYRPCVDDGHSAWGDLCWYTDNATISLNGHSTELIHDADSGEWRLRDDPNWRVIRHTGQPNGDNDGEMWQVISPDGTSYYFGRAAEPGSEQPLNATWTVPVFGDGDEPCATEAEGWCSQAWRWNLSLVVDPHENMDTYFYEKELNYYGRNSSPGLPTEYVRGGWLVGIDFGQRLDNGIGVGPGRLEQHIESPALSQYDRAAIVLNVCRATPGLCSDQYEHFVGALFFAYSDAAIGSDFGIYAGAAIGAGAGGLGGRFTGTKGSSSRLVPGGGLSAHEGPTRGHTLGKHVGKTDSELLGRLQDQPYLSNASTFKDRATAERSIADLLAADAPRIQAWLGSGTSQHIVQGTASGPIGRSIGRGDASARDLSGLRIVLRSDPSMPGGYHILTAFPQ